MNQKLKQLQKLIGFTYSMDDIEYLVAETKTNLCSQLLKYPTDETVMISCRGIPYQMKRENYIRIFFKINFTLESLEFDRKIRKLRALGGRTAL